MDAKMNWLKKTIDDQRNMLSGYLEGFMADLSSKCAAAWANTGTLDTTLRNSLSEIPICRLLYAMNTEGVQVSSNISADSVDSSRLGQDLSTRPFLTEAVPYLGFLLSDVYLSQIDNRSCITAVQGVARDGRMLGFVAADFLLRDLPLLERRRGGSNGWRQMKGDPAIRGGLFYQERVHSAMDERMDDVIAIMDELISERGVFHAKLHFSSSRATLWLVEDPYRYQLHVLDEIMSPSVCLAYPQRPYPPGAAVKPSLIRPVFEQLKVLREADENIYLRSGSLNIFNGVVGLTFSCDGSHYMPAEEFLAKDSSFWFGTQQR
jgi:hypothetical protein